MSRPWMPLYVADYLADTGHLSTVEHGAYMLLIMHYWQKGGLPDDDKRLASIARASLEQWAEIRDTVAEFFAAGWKHPRIDDELEKATKAYEKRASAGKAGGSAKASKSSNATAMLQPEPSNALPSTSTITEITNASALDAAAPVDARTALWSDGVSILRALTGKPETGCRSLVGKWLKATHDDCALVLSKIKTAQADRIGEPVPWITAAVQATSPPSQRTMDDALSDIKSGKLDVFGLINGNSHDTIETSYERTDRGGSGHPVQVHAFPSGRRA